jgi:hypothetical protein
MNTCFSIMPFGSSFNDIDSILKEAAELCGLRYVRGDHGKRPGAIMSQILKEIRNAHVIVADISGHNANVLYELGIAHQLHGTERVVILTQSVDPHNVFDLHQCRQLVYSPDKAGRTKLRRELPVRIKEALTSNSDMEHWSVIRGRLPRTRSICRDLQLLLEKPNLDGVVIRCIAQLSSISVSDHEEEDPVLGKEYKDALLAERDALRQALARGAQFRAVLNPPRKFTKAQLPDRLSARFSRLIGLLEGRSDIRNNDEACAEDVKAIKNCHFVLSPIPMQNLLIIGNEVVYEGMKRGNAGGFDVTHWETDPAVLTGVTDDFERLYEESCREMCRTNPPDGRVLDQLKAFFREASPDTRNE